MIPSLATGESSDAGDTFSREGSFDGELPFLTPQAIRVRAYLVSS